MPSDDLRAWLVQFGIREGTGPPPGQSFARSGWAPRIDLFDHERFVLLRVEVPGLGPDELTLIFDGESCTLTVRGDRRQPPIPPGRASAIRLEIEYGSFERTVELPEAAYDFGDARAELDHGMLSIFVPRNRGVEPTVVVARHRIRVVRH